MRYWMYPQNLKHEIGKRGDHFLLKLAHVMPNRLRMWVVVDSTNHAVFNSHARADGYVGPDALGYKEIYDGALRKEQDGKKYAWQNETHPQ